MRLYIVDNKFDISSFVSKNKIMRHLFKKFNPDDLHWFWNGTVPYLANDKFEVGGCKLIEKARIDNNGKVEIPEFLQDEVHSISLIATRGALLEAAIHIFFELF